MYIYPYVHKPLCTLMYIIYTYVHIPVCTYTLMYIYPYVHIPLCTVVDLVMGSTTVHVHIPGWTGKDGSPPPTLGTIIKILW